MNDHRRKNLDNLRRQIERDNGFDNFDKQFERAQKAVIGLWVFGALVSLALTGVIIWAIVMLVQHFTG